MTEGHVFEASACSESIKIREIEHKYFNKYIVIFLNNPRYFNCKYIFLKSTRYGLEGRGIESRWGEIYRTYPDWLRGPPSLLYNGY